MIQLRNNWRTQTDENVKRGLANNIIGFASEIQDIYVNLKKAIEQVPLVIMSEGQKKEKIINLNDKIKDINTILLVILEQHLKKKKRRDKEKRVRESVERPIQVPGQRSFEFNP